MPREKILIADDEPEVLALCLRIVRSEGYEAKAVTNGLEAIEAAEKERFDLFLTDVLMPEMKGLDAAQAIREFQPEIVCVVMTAYGTMETAIQALKLGFIDFVIKPFEPRELKAAVNRALEKERLRRENERLNALVPLFELNKTLMATIEEDDLARKVLRTAATELEPDLGALMLLDRDQNLHIRAAFGLEALQEASGVAALVISVAQALLETRQPQVLVSASDYDKSQVVDIVHRLNVKSVLYNPLLALDTPVGALILAKREGGTPFAPVDRELLSVLCGQAAIALQNAGLFEEIQRAYRDLQELDHMKSEFINIAAHELRTPLAILMGHAELLQEDIEDSDLKTRLQIIIRNALRLRELINDLLDLQQLQTREARVNVTTFDIKDLIATAMQDFRLMAKQKNIQISANVPSDLMSIRTDRRRILMAFSNLVKNAIEFTPDGGQVGVDVIEHDRELWVSVWDTGVGIPDDQRERVFRPFFQVEASLTREHEGMGLGLSIAKWMTELCGGRIWVESEVGQGSRFTFSVPRHRSQAG